MFLKKENKEEYFMRRALELARKALEEDEVPVGCVITYEDKIIAQAYNQVEKLRDSTAHAEMLAITQAEEFLRSKWLKDCTVYATIEPCFMCASALGLVRVKEVIFATHQLKIGGFGSGLDINKLRVFPRIRVRHSILEEEAKSLIKEFFRRRRQKKWAGS